MRRRAFIALLGGAAAVALPRSAGAQQTMPVVGFIGGVTAAEWAPYVAAFRRGLSETGYTENNNVAIEYRWAEGQYDRLPGMAADLVRRQVSVMMASTTPAALAAKAATTTIPVVFTTISNPVQIGLVASLSRPGGNVTGATQLNVEIGPKLLEVLHEVIPAATHIALLVNPRNPNADTLVANLQAAARGLGLNLHVMRASTEQDLDAAFATMAQSNVGGLVIGGDAFFNSRSARLAAMALQHRIATIYQSRVFAAAGGLMTYGGNAEDVYRLAGGYTGRILKGEKPADLPVIQATKVEMIVNLKTAKALGLAIPLPLLGRADEVIE
jgi:putative ABC transport system substrate-binding protein